eukprot:CAMPEP_0175176622 /NCGR_PEP_ID=MMETSP0087-20121206/33902_1 /TAXON_ID=136419 /ORGANISM="Unknown Unknown, Strain D1" /LENGTH=142 /DNA_ID=CAMNT_0016468447 /DNA_START=82 /DNA_END=510 /DNA_ORIENTATION=+
MSTEETFKMALMPISMGTSIVLVYLASSGTFDLLNVVSGIASFYCAWALYNFWSGRSVEKGQYSHGFVAISCFITQPKMALVGSVLVFINFLVPALMAVLPWPASKLAHVRSKTLLWAYILKAYYVAALLMWAFITYLLIQR